MIYLLTNFLEKLRTADSSGKAFNYYCYES